MAITDWPTLERPREKLLQRGPGALSDAELLAIFLRTGVTGKTAVDLARELLETFGGLRALLEASQSEFCRIPGLGLAKYTQLQACLEIGRRHLEATLKRGDALTDPLTTRRYLMARLRAYPFEVFSCLFLDNRHRVLAFEELFQGTINSASVHPREVVKRALAHNAAAVILAHNHPSGVAEPSQADKAITQRLKEALDLVDIRVLDHVIIGDEETLSFAELGFI
ncbi:DNA repair protein RadC [Candidatus Nitrosoglobus terrae]|uniref:DNA repair protein RadC n=1 Tax=Candidatus Nitrosoglobus terrae TaxID=1630141 RepID=A0A1Q2SPS7_9GAMM|nr:DNA repair protein RadC [Candidatus Nitrosoglobus terrae]BAW81150.1 DNA repair protein RadC [Candidatus Nitrosoglobus terrae]